jgi:hypothetical protein
VYTTLFGLTGIAHEATGFGAPALSTTHIRQFPATNKRSW